ncbi:MAG TPA: hypothetical protein VJN94_04540 [Candidatus Binataceae bacterium]|nr:hypothetical protein [Candidatus Binataceae bacterium]
MNEKMYRVMAVGVAAGMVALFSSQAMAKPKGPPGPKTVTGSVSITGTGGSLALARDCTEGYSHQCPSDEAGVTCECFSIIGAKVTGKFGKGSADVFATLDLDDTLAHTPSLSQTCIPVYGQALLNLSSAIETINFQGEFCGPATVKGKASVGGGWQIVDSTDNASGLGTVTGSGLIAGGSGVNLNLSGSVTFSP